MRVITQFDPTSAQSGTFNAQFPNGTGRLVMYNESNINVIISWGGYSTYLPAWTAMLYCIQTSNVNINWQQQSQLKIINTPISQVVVEAYENSEAIPGTFPAPIVRQTAPALVGNTENVFSATIGFGSTVGLNQWLNIFNPPNSNTEMHFHSARVFVSDPTVGNAAYLLSNSGDDLNLPIGIGITSHVGSNNAPQSVGNATAQDNTAVVGGFPIEGLNTVANQTEDFLVFPDSVTLEPGNNLSMVFLAGGGRPGSPSSGGASGDNPYGITIGSSSATGTLNQAAISDMLTLGITWLRVQVKWSLIDPSGTTTQNQNNYKWGFWDDAVGKCNAAGINIIISIFGAPTQFQGPSSNPLNPSYTATFAGQVATRYNGTNGHGIIQGLEFGNEDYNQGADVTTAPWPLVQQLALTMIAAYPAVKSVFSAVSKPITVGCAAKLNRNSAGYTAWFDTLLNPSTGPYTGGVFQADYLSFHYYTGIPTTSTVCPSNNTFKVPTSLDPGVTTGTVPSIDDAWGLIDAKRTQYSNTTPIWCTESGFQINTNPGRNPCATVDQATQWAYTQKVLDSLRTGGKVDKWFDFTLGYYTGYTANSGNSAYIRDGMSLVQGTLASPVYTTSYTQLKSYIGNNPSWTTPTPPTGTGYVARLTMKWSEQPVITT